MVLLVLLKKKEEERLQVKVKEKKEDKNDEEDQQSIEQLLHDKIEKRLQAWTKGNKKDVVYQIGHIL